MYSLIRLFFLLLLLLLLSIKIISYSQSIPSRFKKDIVCAAKEKETEHVVIEGLQKVVANIGGTHQVSRQDLETIFSEVGSSDGRISCEQMMKLL